jgi:hypothetical protein
VMCSVMTHLAEVCRIGPTRVPCCLYHFTSVPCSFVHL